MRKESDDYPHNPHTEDLSQFAYTVRSNDYSLVYTYAENKLALYDINDLQQTKDLCIPS